VWLLSLLVHVTHYGDGFAFAFQSGFIGVYWGDKGGDKGGVRNSWVYNRWVEPWCSWGTGRGWYGSPVWEIRGPADIWHPNRVDALLTDWKLFGPQLGLLRPRVILDSARHAYEPPSVVLPIWVLLIATLIPVLVAWWRDRGHLKPGHCQNCDYDLTGNVSGVCPECGEAI